MLAHPKLVDTVRNRVVEQGRLLRWNHTALASGPFVLYTVGVLVPDGRVATPADDAWAAAEEVGLPVVVKPAAGNQGKGVSVNLTTEAEVAAAYGIAAGFGGEVLVERCSTRMRLQCPAASILPSATAWK